VSKFHDGGLQRLHSADAVAAGWGEQWGKHSRHSTSNVTFAFAVTDTGGRSRRRTRSCCQRARNLLTSSLASTIRRRVSKRVYIRWTDVTESMVSTHSPFVGVTWHNVWSYWVKIYRVIRIKFNQFKKMSTWSLTYRQSVFKWQQSNKHFSFFFLQDGAENQLA